MSAVTTRFTQMFSLRLPHAERSKLDQLAQAAGVHRSDVVTRLLRQATPEAVARGIGDGAVDSTPARTAPQVVQ